MSSPPAGHVPTLSVCIPTFNFGSFIGETLESILCQAPPEVEVVVLDSASTDDTRATVELLQQKYTSLRYVRTERRGGIDRDMARVVDLARGAHCWLFSADDIMVKGALLRVLHEIATNDDVYLCMHSNHTLTMELVEQTHPVLRSNVDARYDLSDRRQQLEYFNRALTTEAFFSFIGGLIVKRSTWCSVPLNEQFVGSCWAHVARLFELIPRGLSVKFLNAVLLQRRGGNDSFATRGTVRRYALAIQGFQQLGNFFWGNQSLQAFHIRRVLRNEFRLRTFLAAKAQFAAVPTVEDRHLLNSLVAATYSDASLSCFVRRMLFHVLPFAVLQPAYRTYRSLVGKPSAGSS
jgi:abequosyltransferase